MSVAWSFSISGGALANHLWQSTFFALAVWLLTALLRRNPARVRYGLWLAASLKFLVPFSLLIALGGLLPQPRPTVSAAPEAIYSAVDLATQPFPAWEPSPVAASSPTFAQRVAGDLPGILLALWIAGTVAVLLVWFLRWRGLHATLRRAVPAQSGRELDLLRRVEAMLSARAPLQLRLSGELIEPGMFGILRPVLVWPALLTEHLEDEHIQAILTHELVHARRRDNLTAALHMLVESVFWFHPLVWWIGGRLLVERERACDEAVVRLGGQPEAYAESLLKACRFCIESPLPCVSGITGADLAERVRSIMTAAFTAHLSLTRKLLLVSAVGVTIAAPILLGEAATLSDSTAMARFLQVRLPAAPPPPPPRQFKETAQISRATADVAQVGSSSTPPPGTAGKPLAFEVVSIRENKSGSHEGKMDATGDGWRMVNMPFEGLLQVAFVPQPGGPAFFPNGAILGMPAWGRDRYDVVAKVPQSALADWKNPAEQPGMLHAMLQTALAERCGLKVHRERKTIDILALVVAKGGPKLKPADPNAPPHPEASKIPGLGFAVPEDGGKTIRFYGANLALFTNVLDKGGALNVQDRTGLTGKYDFVIHMPDPPAPAPGESAAADDPRYFADAVAEQLGLKLVPAKGQVETLVIDRIHPPSAN